jgi:hypothetical protein
MAKHKQAQKRKKTLRFFEKDERNIVPDHQSINVT